MQHNTDTTNSADNRPNHIQWWERLEYKERVAIWVKYPYMIVGWDKRTVKSISAKEVAALYEAEHPQQEKEVSGSELLDGITQGEWFVGDVDTMGEFTIVTRPKPANGGDIICEAPTSWEASMTNWRKNALLIAQAPTLARENAEMKEKITLMDSVINDLYDRFEEGQLPLSLEKKVEKALL